MAADARDITGPAGQAIFLNGDHWCTFPTFSGFRAARLAHAGGRAGFISVGHHFDFGNWSELHGAFYGTVNLTV